MCNMPMLIGLPPHELMVFTYISLEFSKVRCLRHFVIFQRQFSKFTPNFVGQYVTRRCDSISLEHQERFREN